MFTLIIYNNPRASSMGTIIQKFPYKSYPDKIRKFSRITSRNEDAELSNFMKSKINLKSHYNIIIIIEREYVVTWDILY